MASQEFDSKRYIDTNLDKEEREEVYENGDNMQWTN